MYARLYQTPIEKGVLIDVELPKSISRVVGSYFLNVQELLRYFDFTVGADDVAHEQSAPLWCPLRAANSAVAQECVERFATLAR